MLLPGISIESLNTARLARRRFRGRFLIVRSPVFKKRSGTGIEQEFAPALRCFPCDINRLWMAILDSNRQNYGRGNHGTHD